MVILLILHILILIGILQKISYTNTESQAIESLTYFDSLRRYSGYDSILEKLNYYRDLLKEYIDLRIETESKINFTEDSLPALGSETELYKDKEIELASLKKDLEMYEAAAGKWTYSGDVFGNTDSGDGKYCIIYKKFEEWATKYEIINHFIPKDLGDHSISYDISETNRKITGLPLDLVVGDRIRINSKEYTISSTPVSDAYDVVEDPSDIIPGDYQLLQNDTTVLSRYKAIKDIKNKFPDMN